MKRRITYFISALAVIGMLSGCGVSSDTMTESAAPEYAKESEAYLTNDMYDMEVPEEAVEEPGAVNAVDNESVENSNRKIIKTVNIDAETEDFESFISNVEARVKGLGGYLESTNVSGRSINASKTSMRDANITARIPSQNLDSFVTNVSDMSNITNKSESAEDVTLNYTDTQAHIKSLRTEQERLNELLLQAEDIETIIAIESRITDVRYELESYESRLRSMDNKVDYSTVYIYVKEVSRYTPLEEAGESVGRRIIKGFTENLISAKEFVVDFIVEFIIAIPILVVILIFCAIPVIIIFLIVRFVIGMAKGPEYRAQVKTKRAEKKALRKQHIAEKKEKKQSNAKQQNNV